MVPFPGSNMAVELQHPQFGVEMTAEITPGPAPQSSYVPQFGDASSLILARMKKDSSSGSAAALLSASHTITTGAASSQQPPISTLPLPEQTSSPKDIASLRSPSTSHRLGLKRKREDPSPETIDFTTQNTVSLPPSSTITPRALRPPPPPPPTPACSTCHQSASNAGNILVICSQCPVLQHQQCSTPPIDDFRARDGSFVCRDCLLRGEANGKPRRRLGPAQQDDLERMRQRRLAMLPGAVAPAKPELVGFKGGDASSLAVSPTFCEASYQVWVFTNLKNSAPSIST